MKTISPEYAELNRQLHDTCAFYGCNSHRHLKPVCDLMVKHYCNTVLDYGCGKGAFVRSMEERHPDTPCQGYDPGHPDYPGPPKPADMVVCTDVLEHIEPDCIESVLKEIRALSRKAVFLVIALRFDSSKLLPDGTNPHKIVQGLDDWMADLQSVWGRHGFETVIHDFVADREVTMSIKWP